LNEEAYDLQKTLHLQKEVIEAKLEQLQKMHQTLRVLLSRLEQDQSLTIKELVSFIKGMKTMETIYTSEQLKKLKDRLEKYPQQVREVEESWPKLFKKFEAAMEKGIDVGDASVQELAKEAQHYIELFTGGDKEIEANLDKAYQQNQESALKTWGVKKEIFQYADKARKILLKRKSL
jgi:hypothetical protein